MPELSPLLASAYFDNADYRSTADGSFTTTAVGLSVAEEIFCLGSTTPTALLRSRVQCVCGASDTHYIDLAQTQKKKQPARVTHQLL